MSSYLKYVYAILCAILMFSTFQISSGRSLSANNATDVNNLGAPMSMLNESAAILNNALSNDQFYEANATELNGYKQESWVPTNVILTDAGTTVTEIDQNGLKASEVIESDILDPMFSVNITRNNESTGETTTGDLTTEVETGEEQDVETTQAILPIQNIEPVIPMIECLNLALDIESIFSIQNPLYKRDINTNPFTRSMDPNYASHTQILESLSGIVEKLEFLAEKAHRCDVREKKYNEPFIKGLSHELEEALIDMAEYMRLNNGKSDFENVIAYFKAKDNILTLNYANKDYKNGKENKNEECVCEESDSKKNLAGNE